MRKRRAEEFARAKAVVLKSISDSECKGPQPGAVLIHVTHAKDGSVSARVGGGTTNDCELAECVRGAVREAATALEQAPPWYTLLVHVDESGKLSEAPRETQPLFTQEYCGSAITGRIPAEVIRAEVRSHFGKFRMCYEEVLKVDPKLGGRITTRFIIGLDGTVTEVAASQLTLPSCAFAQCVLDHFEDMTFPKPEGGIVTVTYPIQFAPE
jgi:hypothetical protein